MENLRIASIPIPRADTQSLHDASIAMKQAIDVLVGSVGEKEQRSVTFADLVNMGIITPDQIPPRHGAPPRRNT